MGQGSARGKLAQCRAVCLVCPTGSDTESSLAEGKASALSPHWPHSSQAEPPAASLLPARIELPRLFLGRSGLLEGWDFWSYLSFKQDQ